MRLKEFLIESSINKASNFISQNLNESVVDYLQLVYAKLKNKKPEELFKQGSRDALDLDHLAMIITGLKIIAEPDYRASITKQDVGVNINDAKELFNLLNQVNKLGDDPASIVNVFKALTKLAMPSLKRQRQELEILKVGDDAERDHMAQNIQKLTLKTTQLFNKVRAASTGTRGVDVPTLGDVGRLTP
jgi:hypothetical protein